MTHYWNNKVGKIIDDEFDVRLEGMVIIQLTSMGWNKAAEITNEDIEQIEGNGMFPKETLQGMFRACKRIATECTLYDDFFPYIRKYMGINGCQVHDLTLYKEDYTGYGWEQIMGDLDLDDEDVDSVDVIAIVD